MLSKLSRPLIVAVALSALVAGCGGDDDGGAALTKAEFVKRGDAICARAEARKNDRLRAAINRLTESGKQLNRAREEELVTSVALPPIEQMIEELGELPSPAGEEQRVEELLAEYENAAAEVKADPGAAIGGSQPFSEVDRTAADFGFKTCAEI